MPDPSIDAKGEIAAPPDLQITCSVCGVIPHRYRAGQANYHASAFNHEVTFVDRRGKQWTYPAGGGSRYARCMTPKKRGIKRGDVLYVNTETTFASKGTEVRVISVGTKYVRFLMGSREDSRHGYCHHELLSAEPPR